MVSDSILRTWTQTLFAFTLGLMAISAGLQFKQVPGCERGFEVAMWAFAFLHIFWGVHMTGALSASRSWIAPAGWIVAGGLSGLLPLLAAVHAVEVILFPTPVLFAMALSVLIGVLLVCALIAYFAPSPGYLLLFVPATFFEMIAGFALILILIPSYRSGDRKAQIAMEMAGHCCLVGFGQFISVLISLALTEKVKKITRYFLLGRRSMTSCGQCHYELFQTIAAGRLQCPECGAQIEQKLFGRVQWAQRADKENAERKKSLKNASGPLAKKTRKGPPTRST